MQALWHLAEEHPDACAAAAAGAAGAVVSAMRAHPVAQRVQVCRRATIMMCHIRRLLLNVGNGLQKVCGCLALRHLARNHRDDPGAAAAVDATVGAVEAIVAALRGHLAAEDVQESGCDALGELVKGRPDNQAAAAAVGGLEAVVATLRERPRAATVQTLGCFALGALVEDHPRNRAAAVAAGAAEVAVATIRAYQGPRDRGVRLYGREALQKLLCDDPKHPMADFLR